MHITIKEIFKKGALTVKRTVVHPSNSCGYKNSRASNLPFLKLLYSLLRYLQLYVQRITNGVAEKPNRVSRDYKQKNI